MAAPMAMPSPIELGFVEKSPNWRLISQFFPSKVGGKPAWLNLKEIPGTSDLSCPICGKVLVFLLQLYCPFTNSAEDGHVLQDINVITRISRCFHRSVYIFCCREPSCYKEKTTSSTRVDPFVVLRCQLQRSNDFFSYNPPDLENEIKQTDIVSPIKFGVKLCAVCGSDAGTKKCGRCNVVAYCCRDHQLLDWRSGHKIQCGKGHGSGVTQETTVKNLLFPEYELVTETEESGDEEEECESKSLSKCVQGKDKMGGCLTEELKSEGFQEKDLVAMARGESEDDKQLLVFKERIATDPEQVLRYQKNGKPLFISAFQQPRDEDIPPCQCGAKRIFEFQVLPQLLSHLEVDSLGDSIDWGTLLIYTCSQSCQDGPAYHHEFLWKQDFQNDSI